MAKMPPKKQRHNNRRLSPAEWMEAEELYRTGWTQAQIADKYNVRVETVSRHMTKGNVKGGERAETVRAEIAAALQKKLRDFADLKAQRQIDSKELFYKMNNILVSTFAKEYQAAMVGAKGLPSLSASAKALKDAVLALKVSREEMYVLLDVADSFDKNELPDLVVSSMSEEEEEELRSRVETSEDDEEIPLADQMADAVKNIEHQVDTASVG